MVILLSFHSRREHFYKSSFSMLASGIALLSCGAVRVYRGASPMRRGSPSLWFRTERFRATRKLMGGNFVSMVRRDPRLSDSPAHEMGEVGARE